LSGILKNKVVVLTRSTNQSKDAVEELEKNGATVISFPTIEIVPLKNYQEFDRCVKEFSRFDYIIFTSANAVKSSVIRMNQIQTHLNFDSIMVVALGEKTALTCRHHNIPVHIVPTDFSATGVANELRKTDLINKNIFIPRSAIAREDLPEKLSQCGANVTCVPVYDTIIPDDSETREISEKILKNKPDMFIFTSPSTFNNLLTIFNLPDPEDYFKDTVVAAIGPTTKNAIRDKNIDVQITPVKYTMKDLIDSTLSYFSKADKVENKNPGP
jgi:uroporphyrinogen-III synthase